MPENSNVFEKKIIDTESVRLGHFSTPICYDTLPTALAQPQISQILPPWQNRPHHYYFINYSNTYGFYTTTIASYPSHRLAIWFVNQIFIRNSTLILLWIFRVNPFILPLLLFPLCSVVSWPRNWGQGRSYPNWLVQRRVLSVSACKHFCLHRPERIIQENQPSQQ